MRIRVEAEVYPTESREKVIKAVKNIFPSIELSCEAVGEIEVVHGDVQDMSALENLKNMLKARRIRAAARSILKQSVKEGRLVFYMNKQAAYAGHASFTEPFVESPLPPIKVEIEAEDLDNVIEWLTE